MTTQDAVNHFGSIRDLANALQIWPQTVYLWGKYPPTLRQYQIEKVSGGALKIEGEKKLGK